MKAFSDLLTPVSYSCIFSEIFYCYHTIKLKTLKSCKDNGQDLIFQLEMCSDIIIIIILLFWEFGWQQVFPSL